MFLEAIFYATLCTGIVLLPFPKAREVARTFLKVALAIFCGGLIIAIFFAGVMLSLVTHV